ncbi:YdcF family protein [Gordonia sp. SL306]|uniref:YdcF family protein n=1 Tax=Gordonia sp. SL306 TaxID=2995145 RepID=UPI002270525D|nr:YdcF family protein [Gordonia sp. SL306]WAC56194.1 YdcF family protein [Gordonia sp. SL306]
MTVVIALGVVCGGWMHTAAIASANPGAALESTRSVSPDCRDVVSGHTCTAGGPGAAGPLLLRINPFGTRIIVLGAALNHDGSMKPVLLQRLRAALPLAREVPQARVITTGGLPRHGRTEAQAMKDWLVVHGIAPVRITPENRSRTTVENARNCARILSASGSTGVVLVTSPNHITRAMKDFRRAVGGAMPITGVTSR